MNVQKYQLRLAFVILAAGVLIAAGVSFFPSNIPGVEPAGAGQNPQWTQNTGLGISAPACGSASASAPTCSGSQPVITFTFSSGVFHSGGSVITWYGTGPWPGVGNNGGTIICSTSGNPTNCTTPSFTWTADLSDQTYSWQATANTYGVFGQPPSEEIGSGSFITPNCATGTVNIDATLDGQPWRNQGSITYNYTGPISGQRTDTPLAAISGVPVGAYTLSYVSGGPAGKNFQIITPSATQTLGAGGTITFTFNFVSPPQTLSVSKSGNGSGTVTSNPVGISCGSVCSANFNYNTSVTLTADPAAGSTFTGWSGSGCSGTGTCTVTMTQARSVTASFALNTYTLSVSKSGNGSGTVTSNPVGISCGSVCSAQFNYNTSVTLTASPAAGSTFTGWSGEGCSGTGTCTVTMTQARNVTASFTLNQYTLSVSKTGSGSGTVISNPAGINCGSVCSANFNYGTSVTLTASPSAGSSFTGWSGSGCSGTGNCTVSMTQNRSVTAAFNKPSITLNPTSFTFTGNSGGPTPPAQTLNIKNDGVSGTTLNWSGTTNQNWCHISPTSGSLGGGSSQNTSVSVDAPSNVGTFNCTVTISDPNAQNSPQTANLTYTVSGNLTVNSSPITGISITSSTGHGGTTNYQKTNIAGGTSISLTAPQSFGGYNFSSWSGCDSQSGQTCNLTLGSNRTVTANYTLSSRTLSVSKSGNGSGTVTSSPSGISCGSTCSASFNYGISVTLTASPSAGSTFTGWSGEGCSGTGTCIVSMTQNRSVTASFNKPVITLNPTSFTFTGITGGATPSAQTMTIQNTGTTGTTLNWSGTTNQNWCYISPTSGSLGGGSSQNTSVSVDAPSNVGTFYCTVTISDPNAQNTPQTAQITYTVSAGSRTLSVAKTGTGTGTITSSPSGINCGSTCSANFDYGVSVTLSASPSAGSTFSGWSGDCSGTGTCTVSMTQNRNVTANFTLNQYTLSVAVSGSGSVSGTGISCPGDCSETYNYGTNVTLTASPAAGWVFSGWSGDCSGTGTCTISMTQNRSVTATFTVTQRTLSVSKTGNGSGTVTSNPAGINCGSACSATYNYGTSVTLTASPSAGSTFTGWSGACTGTGSCTVTMTENKSVTAAFNKPIITLNPTSLTFTGVSGGPTPSPQTLNIKNDGASGTTLNWSGTTNQNWCHISPTSGSISGGSSQNTSISVDAPSNVGTFYCTITISDPSAANSPQTVQVTYEVPNQPPSATNLQVSQPNYCVSGPAGIFSWTFSDSDPGDYQTAYRVQVDNNSSFSSPEDDSGKIISSSNSYATPLGKLSYNTTYYWRLMVWDSRDLSSSWTSGPSFTTPRHAYPSVDFSWAPPNPSTGEEVQFSDQSTVYGGASKSSWSWTFQDGSPSSSSQQNPIIKFLSAGQKSVTLRVTDSDGFACQVSKTVNAQLPLPEWKEIAPF